MIRQLKLGGQRSIRGLFGCVIRLSAIEVARRQDVECTWGPMSKFPLIRSGESCLSKIQSPSRPTVVVVLEEIFHFRRVGVELPPSLIVISGVEYSAVKLTESNSALFLGGKAIP
jgi:hypothetical protein